jgi:hypothetical protein
MVDFEVDNPEFLLGHTKKKKRIALLKGKKTR